MDTTVGTRTVVDGAGAAARQRTEPLKRLGEVRLDQVPQGLARLSREIVLNGRLEAVDADAGIGRVVTAAGTVTLTLPAEGRPGDGLVLHIAPGTPPRSAVVFRAAARAGDPLTEIGSAPPVEAASRAEAEAAFLARLPQVEPPVPPETGLQPGTIFTARSEPVAEAAAVPPAPVRLRLMAATVPNRATLPAPREGLAARAEALGVPLWEATVTGRSKDGTLYVRTAEGARRLDLRATPPLGTVLTALVLAEAPADGRAAATALTAVRQGLLALSSIDRATAETVMETIVPRPDGRLAASLAFTLSRVRAGDARGWLGDVGAALLERHGHADLLAALGDDFREQARRWAETPAEHWRTLTFPVFDGNLLGTGRLQVKTLPAVSKEDGRAAVAPSGQRFLIDLDMSRLGPMQLDGLVRAQRFNLMIRSRDPLPAPVRTKLQESFTAALAVIDYAGAIGFRVGAGDLVKTETIERRSPGVGVVV